VRSGSLGAAEVAFGATPSAGLESIDFVPWSCETSYKTLRKGQLNRHIGCETHVDSVQTPLVLFKTTKKIKQHHGPPRVLRERAQHGA
jgi:hypothetical protein